MKKHLLNKLMVLAMSMLASVAFAGEAGTVANLVGKVTVTKADGSSVAVKIKDKVNEGDTLVTEKGAFAMIKYVDGGEMLLRPDTQVKVVEYKFVETQPLSDKSEFNVVKGGLRRLTGLIGKRGDKDADKLVTATATAGIRGTIYDVVQCKGDCDKLADGVYFKVKEGEIVVKNDGGIVNIKAGEFGYVKSLTDAPAKLAKDPGLPQMNPPKSMQPPAAAGCEV